MQTGQDNAFRAFQYLLTKNIREVAVLQKRGIRLRKYKWTEFEAS